MNGFWGIKRPRRSVCRTEDKHRAGKNQLNEQEMFKHNWGVWLFNVEREIGRSNLVFSIKDITKEPVFAFSSRRLEFQLPVFL